MAKRIDEWQALLDSWAKLDCTEGKFEGRPAVYVSRPENNDIISVYTPDTHGYSMAKMAAEKQRQRNADPL